MPRIYFDTNVYSNLRADKAEVYRDANQLLNLYQNRLSFYFSTAHIRDKRKDQTTYKFDDFAFMEKIVRDNYLAYDPIEKIPGFYLATPTMVFEDDDKDDLNGLLNFFDHSPDDQPEMVFLKSFLKSTFSAMPVPDSELDISQIPENQRKFHESILPANRQNLTMFDVMENMAKMTRQLFFDSELYKQLRNTLDGTMNNGKVTLNGEVDFNEAFKETHLQKTFLEVIKENMHHPNKEEIPFYDFYQVAYQMLDSLGIDKDKITEKNSLTNIHNDALHSYFAHYCDLFVTDDKATAKKTKALYQLFEIDTKVVTTNEFNQLVPELLLEFRDHKDWFFQKLNYDLTHAERDAPFVENDIVCQRLKRNHRYLDFFDVVVLLTGSTTYQIALCKGYSHALSEPSFSERARIVSASIFAFGVDIENKGDYIYQDVEKRQFDNACRKWMFDKITIELKNFDLLKKYVLLITIPETDRATK